MKVVGVQLNIAWENKEVNYQRVRELLDHGPVTPGSLILLPEMFATGYSMNVNGIYEEEGGPTENFLKEIAIQFQSYIMGGLVAKSKDGRGLNQALVISPAGEVLARYNKLHPFSFAGETNYYTSGNQLFTVPIALFSMSPFVCYDLRFPEIFRHTVQRGANLFAVIACWPNAREEHWMTLLRARAIENESYVVGINRCGNDPKLEYSGRSLIVDPKGKILADGGNDEGLVYAVLDFEVLDTYRKQFPALQDIRPEYLHD